MSTNNRQKRECKLRKVRENEGLSLVELARSSGIAPATLSKAEDGERIRKYVWGKILKGMNKMSDKRRNYEMADICG
jgi:predicted transcriptional regulator